MLTKLDFFFLIFFYGSKLELYQHIYNICLHKILVKKYKPINQTEPNTELHIVHMTFKQTFIIKKKKL